MKQENKSLKDIVEQDGIGSFLMHTSQYRFRLLTNDDKEAIKLYEQAVHAIEQLYTFIAWHHTKPIIPTNPNSAPNERLHKDELKEVNKLIVGKPIRLENTQR